MTNDQWLTFFRICAQVLGPGHRRPTADGSWCAWTTFGSLKDQVHYWSAGLPRVDELCAQGTQDGGTWGQPFDFHDIAHLVIPKTVLWEERDAQGFKQGSSLQDIERLSRELSASGVPHRLTELVLEVKLY